MQGIVEFLTEGSAKNLHLEHLEDEILNTGFEGGSSAINFLRSLRDMLAGKSSSKVIKNYNNKEINIVYLLSLKS